ncbi:MAG TPA: carboxypeptidase regulatory-like domain-containing protein [Terracidiphilus sp.]|nr:carboxypeptidase regulatory-like domain-containing protein [Terracidiphilus sp.]
MLYRHTRSVLIATLVVVAFLFALPLNTFAQTFRGGINGTVTDQSGAVVPNASVEATDAATGVSHKTITSSAGEFGFQDMPLGTYTVTASAPGFQASVISKVPVTAGTIYTIPIRLSIEKTATTVEVDAAAITLDTTSTTQTAEVGGIELQDTPLNGRDFTQLIILTPGFSNSGAGGYGSLNGTRANQINWQIDGIDNNDLWHNIPAVNQGGVSGIAGIILPIDAVDTFSAQTEASAESGRNPGGSVNLSLKSGGNAIHGSAYYYNRNELFGATNPFTAPEKQKVRNYNFGFSASGPFVKDHLFWFTTFEKQRFVIGVPQTATEPDQAWQAAAINAIHGKGYGTNAVMTSMITTLWPSDAISGGSGAAPQTNNYISNTPEFGYSYNGLAKIDYTINDKNSLTAHWFVGQGNQVAPVGSSLPWYYEVAPIHVQNYALVFNHVFSPSITNQVLAGVNYFNQIFNDSNTKFDVASMGFVTGSTLPGSPHISISGFDPIGETPPEGRNDITGHLTDDLSWVVGKHQFKLGGEFRQAQLDEFYQRHALGSFTFDGTQGPDQNPTITGDTWDARDLRVDALADFLTGRISNASIALGNPDRQVFVNTWDLFAQDAWQITPKLNVNFGVRWDYEGPLHNSLKNLSVFRPNLGGTGIAIQGVQISNLYDPKYTNVSPRIGLSYQATRNTVIRLGAGLYYDTPNLNPFLDNRPGNGAPNGVEGNPTGPGSVHTTTVNGMAVQSGVDIFNSGTGPSQNSLFSVAQNFVPSHNVNYNVQLEQSITRNVVAQLGYVGTEGRHLLSILDINQAELGGGPRPYDSVFTDGEDNPLYSFINEIQSIGTSNYNSLQATLRATNIHGVTLQAAYTWSHSFDEVTAYRGALPQDSTNFKGDYGPSDFDVRNIFTGLVSWDVPGAHVAPLLTRGWQINSLMTFHGGAPFSVYSSSDTSGTNDGNQRANLVPGVNPYAGFRKGGVVGGQGLNWLNPAAFTDAPSGTWGTTSRNEFVGPGYGDVDLSVFKNTKIGERVTTQFRIEMFNLFNRTNYAPPLQGNYDPSYTYTNGFQLFTTIGNFNGAPGIGAGEPYNTQFALKVIF